jgi:hypothetical protein
MYTNSTRVGEVQVHGADAIFDLGFVVSDGADALLG